VTLPACKLGSAYVEIIHDRLVAQMWPGTDPVQSDEPRDTALLESAVNSPFQSAFGEDIHPYTLEKGAVLFRSLNSNHCFLNGNKRTAVLALDTFLLANGYCLILSNEDMYKLAEKTASYKKRELSHEQALTEIIEAIKDDVVPFETIEAEGKKNERFLRIYEGLVLLRDKLRSDPMNSVVHHPNSN
jgi:death-on-curing family protein